MSLSLPPVTLGRDSWEKELRKGQPWPLTEESGAEKAGLLQSSAQRGEPAPGTWRPKASCRLCRGGTAPLRELLWGGLNQQEDSEEKGDRPWETDHGQAEMQMKRFKALKTQTSSHLYRGQEPGVGPTPVILALCEAEAGGLKVQGQPQQFRNLARPCLNKIFQKARNVAREPKLNPLS